MPKPKKVKPGVVVRFISDYGANVAINYAYIQRKEKRKSGPWTYYKYYVGGFYIEENSTAPFLLRYDDIDESVLDMWLKKSNSAILDAGSAEIFDAIFKGQGTWLTFSY